MRKIAQYVGSDRSLIKQAFGSGGADIMQGPSGPQLSLYQVETGHAFKGNDQKEEGIMTRNPWFLDKLPSKYRDRVRYETARESGRTKYVAEVDIPLREAKKSPQLKRIIAEADDMRGQSRLTGGGGGLSGGNYTGGVLGAVGGALAGKGLSEQAGMSPTTTGAASVLGGGLGALAGSHF